MMVHFRYLIYYKSSSSKTKDRQLKTRNRERSYAVYSSESHILKVAKKLFLENERLDFTHAMDLRNLKLCSF